MSSGKIDNPVEASFEAWRLDSPTLDERLTDLAQPFVGAKFVVAGLIGALKDQFATASRFQRIEYLLNGIRLGFHALQLEIGNSTEQIGSVNAKIEGEPFREAVAAACEEAARATTNKKIEQMSKVLVNYVRPIPCPWAAPDEDVATMIRDLAQLGNKDVQVLNILANVHATAIANMPNLHDPHQFSKETPALTIAIGNSGMHRDDFLSTCERLRGFGLTADVLRNLAHMSPEDFCYRPTRRGLVLLDYLRSS